MRRRRLVAALSGGVLAAGLTSVSSVRAGTGTLCIGRVDVFQVTPGISMEPSTGTAVTVVTESEECNGPVEGHVPTGTISTRHVMTYGYLDPDTCSGIEVRGWADHSIPTADGVVVLRNHFTAAIQPIPDPAGVASFSGERMSGQAWVESVEGDCVDTPLTRVQVGWIGTWHGPGGGS